MLLKKSRRLELYCSGGFQSAKMLRHDLSALGTADISSFRTKWAKPTALDDLLHLLTD
jgi:hypothetical protein